MRKMKSNVNYYEIYHKKYGEVSGWGQGQQPFVYRTREGAKAYIDKMVKQKFYKKGELAIRKTSLKELAYETALDYEDLVEGVEVK